MLKRLIDPLEKQAVQLACSRLQALPCRWDRCDIVLNSKHSLLRHLNEDHKPIPKQGGNVSSSSLSRLHDLKFRRLDSHSFVDGLNVGGNAVYERITWKDTHSYLSSAHLKVRQDAPTPTPY